MIKNVNYIAFNIIISIIIIIIPFLSFIILGQDSFLPIGDGLDSNHIYLKIHAQNIKNKIGSDDFPQPVGGVKKHKDIIISPILLLFILFPPLTAEVINKLLISLIAYFGMLILLLYLNPQAKKTKFDFFWVNGIALAYSLCYFWPYAGISVAGLPLIFYAYITSDEKPLRSILISAFYAWYSDLALVGMFLLVVLAIYELVQIIKKGFRPKKILFIALLAIFYILFNTSLILSVIDPLFVSHRAEFNLVKMYDSIKDAAILAAKMFLFNVGHNSGYPTLIIISFIATMIILLYKKKPIPQMAKKLLFLYIAIILISFLLNNKIWVSFQQHIPVLKMLQLQRFYWLLLPIQYLIFYITLSCLNDLRMRKVLTIILVLQIGILYYHINHNTKQVVKKVIGMENRNISYNQFYSSDLFEDIKNFINKPQDSYRVVSVGLYPAVPLFNGFYTIDGYYSEGYPLEHKKIMGKMQEEELKKNPALASTFYDWGSSCLLYSDDIDKKVGYSGDYGPPIIRKDSNIEINDLKIDSKILRQMNCQYAFSAVPIKNANEIGFFLEKSFENKESPYKIYLYAIRV